MRKLKLPHIFKVPAFATHIGQKKVLTFWVKSIVITLISLCFTHVVIYELGSISGFVSAEKSADFQISDIYNSIADYRDTRQASQHVTVIAVDDCSRQEVLDVLELVSEYQPKVIALDVFFKTPSTDSAQVLNTLSTTPNLVLPRIIRRQADGQYQYTNFSFVEKYVDTHYGYVNLNASALNDVIRDFTPWQITANGDTLFHIATAMAKIADPDQCNKLQERNKGVETIKFSSIDIPIIPYEEILYGNDDEYLSRNLTNKAVIIGDTIDLHDMYTTPLKGLVPGVLIHAHSLHTILTASYTDSTPNWLNWLIAIIISILFLFANMAVKEQWSHLGNMVMRLLQVALMFALVFVGAYWYNHHLQYLDFSPVIVMLGFCSLSADIYDGILAGVLQIKKFIQSH